MPIVTLQWNDNIAYGPRGTRYELTKIGELYDVRKYSPASAGTTGPALAQRVSRDDAMLAAQRDAERLTDEVGAEAEAIAGGGRSQLTRR